MSLLSGDSKTMAQLSSSNPKAGNSAPEALALNTAGEQEKRAEKRFRELASSLSEERAKTISMLRTSVSEVDSDSMVQCSSSSKRKAGNAAYKTDPPTPEALALGTADNDQEGHVTKRTRELALSLSEEYICAITQELMVDPVTTDDGNTYERMALQSWLETSTKCPLDPSVTIDPNRLISSRAIFKSIEKLVNSGNIDEGIRSEWLARKKKVDLAKAQKFFAEGKVLEAAKLGLSTAQAYMSDNYFFGTNGFEKDLDKSFEFATKAAEAGDSIGQFRLGYLYMSGTTKDWGTALKWYKRAAEQGCFKAATNTGSIYDEGGHGVQKDLKAAFTWYKKAADQGRYIAQYVIGIKFYYGRGVAKHLGSARGWFVLSADQGLARAQRFVGMMMVKGDGGSKSFGAGTILLEKAAAQGDEKAMEFLSDYEKLAEKALAVKALEVCA